MRRGPTSRRILRGLACVAMVPGLFAACGVDGARLTKAPLQPTPEVAADSELTAQVAAAYHDLRPSPAMGMGVNVVVNEGIRERIGQCVTAKGFDFWPWPLDMESRQTLDAPSNANGVDPQWAHPPDREGAARGLGLSASPYWSEEESKTLSTAPKVSAEYSRAIGECSNTTSNPVAFDSATMDRLHAEMIQIGQDTMKLEGFDTLRKRYAACIKERGFDFDDPAIVLDLAKAKLGTESAVTFERGAAVADAECRLPLYDEFIRLNATAWTKWLTQSAPAVASVVAQFNGFEEAARRHVEQEG